MTRSDRAGRVGMALAGVMLLAGPFTAPPMVHAGAPPVAQSAVRPDAESGAESASQFAVQPAAQPGLQTRALIVSGAAGSDEYAERQRTWREALFAHLTQRLAVPPSHVTVLTEREEEGQHVASASNVREALAALATTQTDADTLFIVLFGHGTFDGVAAKFNLVGPDLDADQWRTMLAGIPGRLVFVQTASASFPFLKTLAAPNRIVITSTAAVGQKYDTVFAEHFVAAFAPDTAHADLDQDGRISIWEAFSYASNESVRYYEQRGQLAVEKALLDDTGKGIGRDLLSKGDDGLLASRTFLDPDPLTAASSDPSVTLLIGRRNTLEGELDELKRKQTFMPPADYRRELERLVIDIARTSREIRLRTRS